MPSTPWYRLTPEQVSADVTRQLRYQLRKRLHLAKKHDTHTSRVAACPFCERDGRHNKPIKQLQPPNSNTITRHDQAQLRAPGSNL